MEGGPPNFPADFTCPQVLRILLVRFSFRLHDFHILRCSFPTTSAMIHDTRYSPLPRRYFYQRFSLFRFRSPLLAKSRLISFPLPTEMFQFGRFPPYDYVFIVRFHILSMEGFPIRKSADITAICASPQLIAACHVLRRLPMPRHSPCALISLNSFFISFMIWCMSYRKSVFLLVVILFTLRLERP